MLRAGAAFPPNELGIIPGRTCWVVNVDGLVLAADGSLLDVLAIAAKVCCSLLVGLALCCSYIPSSFGISLESIRFFFLIPTQAASDHTRKKVLGGEGGWSSAGGRRVSP